jgi:uncharacterized protein YjiS (DUF1127 family)
MAKQGGNTGNSAFFEPMERQMYRYNVHETRVILKPRRSFVLGAAVGVFELLAVWRERRRQRFSLARLDDRMLRDIGVTFADVEGEISKPFWR